MDKNEFGEIAKRLVTKTEAASLLGISRPTLYKWITNHDFPIVKVGDLERVDMKDVDAWLEEKKRNSQ